MSSRDTDPLDPKLTAAGATAGAAAAAAATMSPNVSALPSDALDPAHAARRRLLIGLALAAVYVIWGSTYLALRYVVEGLPPLFAAGTRYLIAGTILFVFLRLRGAPSPTAREWLWSAPVGESGDRGALRRAHGERDARTVDVCGRRARARGRRRPGGTAAGEAMRRRALAATHTALRTVRAIIE